MNDCGLTTSWDKRFEEDAETEKLFASFFCFFLLLELSVAVKYFNRMEVLRTTRCDGVTLLYISRSSSSSNKS